MVKIEEIKPAVKTELDEQKQDLFIQYNFSYCFSVSRNLQLNFKKLCFDFFLLNIFFWVRNQIQMEPKSTRIRIGLLMLANPTGLNFVELGVSLVRLLHSAKRVRISTYCYNFAYNLCAVVLGGVGGGGGLARLDDGGGGGG